MLQHSDEQGDWRRNPRASPDRMIEYERNMLTQKEIQYILHSDIRNALRKM